MHVPELVLEVTRDCNFECGHCSRGKAQNVTMTVDTIAKALVGVSSIGKVIFAGGEPLLETGLGVLVSFMTMVAGRITYDHFETFTNGSLFSGEVAYVLAEAVTSSSSPELCRVFVSNTLWHQLQRSSKNLNRLKTLNCVEMQDENQAEGILNQGRAAQRGEGFWTRHTAEHMSDITTSKGTIQQCGHGVYINAKGEYIFGYDWSYEEQPDHVLGTVDTHSMEDILLRRRMPTTFSLMIDGVETYGAIPQVSKP